MDGTGSIQLKEPHTPLPSPPGNPLPSLWASRPPLTLGWGVLAVVDGEIGAVQGAGWWVSPSSAVLLVRTASADSSADAR